MTSEELTAKRRAERQQFKQDRAKAIQAAFAEAEVAFETEGRVVKVALSGPSIPSAATWKPSEPSNPPSIPEVATSSQDADQPVDEEEPPLEDMEHLQLTFAEAWFLLWTMDCLTILDSQTVAYDSLFSHLRCHNNNHHRFDSVARTHEHPANLVRFPVYSP